MKSVWILLILLVAAFLISAKTHGRQYRLERELEGHWTVSFTSQNHPWVESFWFRQRVAYWSIAALAFLLLVITRRGNIFLRIVISFPLSMIAAFILTGLLSAARLFVKITGGYPVPGEEWLSSAIRGSVLFWLLTVLSVIVLVLFARKLKQGWY